MKLRMSLLVVAVLAVACAVTTARGQGLIEFTGLGDGTSWNDPANWETLPDPSGDPSSRFRDPLDPNLVGSNRLPLAGEEVFLRNAVTTTLSEGTNIVNRLYVGGREYRVPAVQSGTVTPKGTSVLVMTGGSLGIPGGTYWENIGGTAIVPRMQDGRFSVGDYYRGEFYHLDGQISSDYIYIGRRDPSSDPNTIPYGYYYMGGGMLTNGGTETMRINVGHGTNVYAGTDGKMVITGGTIRGSVFAEKPPYFNIAGGTSAGAPHRARGTVLMSGGSVVTENWTVGHTFGDGIFEFSGGTIINSDAIAVGYGSGSNGTMTMTGGRIETSALRAGNSGRQADGNGTISIYGGTLQIASELALGNGVANTDGSYYYGLGTLNIHEPDPSVPMLVEFTSAAGDIILGQGNNKSDPARGPAPGVGVLNIYGGKFEISASASDIILGGESADNLPGTESRGTMNVLGGSFVTTAGIRFTPVSTHTHGVFKVSKDAYCEINGVLSMNAGTAGQALPYLGRTSTLIVEVAPSGNTLIHLDKVPILADTLRVEGVGGWRPKEGAQFMIMTSTAQPSSYDWYEGDFYVFDSNLTTGHQLSDPNDPNSDLLPLWKGIMDDIDLGLNNYWVEYQGLTAGDANGDHVVNAGDLSLMGGGWMKSGQSWGTGDFNADGLVNAGDLALMGGNWMWSLPSPAPGGASLPEPATLVLLGLGAAFMVRRRRT